MAENTLKWQKWAWAGGIIFASVGIYLRFYHITASDFIFYDEGYYLNFNRGFVEFAGQYRFQNIQDWLQGFYTCLRLSLPTGKALWFFLIDSRAFWGWGEVWFFPRLVAAIAGSLTLGMVFLFARRFYNSSWVAYVSVILLAVMPSHVFYSRLAMQETLSTLFFLGGFYLYLFPDRLNVRTFLSALVLVGAYFTNYRLIVLPVLVLVTEVFMGVSQKRIPNYRKYLWHVLTFFSLVFLIGSIDRGQNLNVTFSWMGHQAQLGKEQFQAFNLWSYPYYIFKLESIPFGLLFFGNMYYFFRKQTFYLYPLVLVVFQMLIFSFAQDKAARYLCVVMPFMVMAASSLIVFLFEENKNVVLRTAVSLVFLWTLSAFTLKSIAFAGFQSAYRPVMEVLSKADADVKVASSQPWVQNLYVKNKKNVVECPKEYPLFFDLQRSGFKYLVIDPQAYISFTDDGRKFSQLLTGYLRFITTNIKPIKVLSHFNRPVLERFVFEHNENLKRSLDFLNTPDASLGQLKIYDMAQCTAIINKWLAASHQAVNP